MIGLPHNDLRCLGTITETVAELVNQQDIVFAELASKYETAEQLAAWIRSLPQKDDIGDPSDGPKIEACDPPQRLRLPAPDPNCVERAALYIGVAEMIDPSPFRQLATLDTPIGLHTFPVENGVPIILDPRVPRNCLDSGLVGQQPRRVVEAIDAVELTVDLAEKAARNVRNGPARARRARNAVMRIVNEGIAPATQDELDAVGWLLALADRAARKYGSDAIKIVRTSAQAIADLADEALARTQRNLALEIGGVKLEPAPWLSGLAQIAGRIGLDIGSVALQTKLSTLGIGADMIGLVEDELNREGLTLGTIAHPPRLPAVAHFFDKNAA